MKVVYRTAHSAVVDCGNGFFREFYKVNFSSQDTFALEVIKCAMFAPYTSEEEYVIHWEDRITLFVKG